MPIPTYKNRVAIATATTGTTSVTLGAVESGCIDLDASDDGKYFDALFLDAFVSGVATACEVARECLYTHATRTLTRGTLEASSTGSVLNLSGSAKVYVTHTAERIARANLALNAVTPGGRLTLESGVPVSITDQTAKTTIYYTPHVHNIINLWDGASWVPTEFAEVSMALGTLTSGKPYDVFAYLSGGALALELLAWTSDSARATAVTLQDGRYCKSGDKTRLLLGTFYTTGATTTEDSLANRYLANHYNAMPRPLSHTTGDAGHTYLGAVRAYNNSTSHRVNFVTSVVAAFDAAAGAILSNTVSNSASDLFLGYDSTSTASDFFTTCSNLGTTGVRGGLSGFGTAAPGKHYIQMLERASGNTGNFSFGILRGNIEC